ncbi:MAG: enoyl-CoA hydratase/isomerase family protein [Brevibacillus sp.]|nr:enoyl-CoA hydratase/isomerase family protein [Brevibacillus sp.]
METIITEQMDGVAVITLNRPHVHNALNMQMIEELRDKLGVFRNDPTVRVVVFTGAGDSFVSGGDLEQFGAARDRDSALPLLAKAAELIMDIDSFPKPTIAMINGTAVGGGAELAIACHFRFASETARIGFVQIALHITTGWGGGSLLLNKLGESQALTMLLSGERFKAKEAEQLGFLNGVSPSERLRDDVLSFARKLAAQPEEGIRSYLRLLAWKRSREEMTDRIRREIEQCAGLWGSERHVAAISRFLHKR